MLSHELRMARSAHHTYPSVRRKKNYSSRINRLTEVNGIYIISLHLSILPFVGSCERPNGIHVEVKPFQYVCNVYALVDST